jgi:hypothetical protein
MTPTRGAERHRFLDVMGDEQRGLARLRPDAAEFPLQRRARHRVQRAEGFVHQQDARVVRQRASDLHPLLHPAREFAGCFAPCPAQPTIARKRSATARRSPLLTPRSRGPEGDVAARRQPVIQAVMPLEHYAAVGARATHRLAVQQDAPGGRRLEPRQHVRRWSCRARSAKQAEELASCSERLKSRTSSHAPGAAAIVFDRLPGPRRQNRPPFSPVPA